MMITPRCMAVVFALACACACAELPTGVPSASRPASSTAAASFSSPIHGRSVYFCEVSRKVDSRTYIHGTLTLNIPAAERSPNGAVRVFRYRGYANGAELELSAECQVPFSPAALQHVARLLGGTVVTRPWHGQERAPYRTDVALDPVVTTACRWGGEYPACYASPGSVTSLIQCPAVDPYCGGAGGGEFGGWAPLGTSGDPDPTTVGDGTGRNPCSRDANGNCITRPLNQMEWDSIKGRIDKIKEVTDYCRGAKAALQSLWAQGRDAQRIRFWDGYDKVDAVTQRFGQNLSDQLGRFIEYDSYWAWHDPAEIVHEGIHFWINQVLVSGGSSPVPDGTTDETWIRGVQNDCV